MPYQDPPNQPQGPSGNAPHQQTQGMAGSQSEMSRQPPQQGSPQMQQQPPQAGVGTSQQQQPQQATRPSEREVTTPTLQWVTLSGPQDRIPLGEEDYVLESIFDMERGCWEVLVLLQPSEDEGEREEESEE